MWLAPTRLLTQYLLPLTGSFSMGSRGQRGGSIRAANRGRLSVHHHVRRPRPLLCRPFLSLAAALSQHRVSCALRETYGRSLPLPSFQGASRTVEFDERQSRSSSFPYTHPPSLAPTDRIVLITLLAFLSCLFRPLFLGFYHCPFLFIIPGRKTHVHSWLALSIFSLFSCFFVPFFPYISPMYSRTSRTQYKQSMPTVTLILFHICGVVVFRGTTKRLVPVTCEAGASAEASACGSGDRGLFQGSATLAPRSAHRLPQQLPPFPSTPVLVAALVP